VSVELGQPGRLLSYGPAFRPNTVGQPTNFRAEIKRGPYTRYFKNLKL